MHACDAGSAFSVTAPRHALRHGAGRELPPSPSAPAPPSQGRQAACVQRPSPGAGFSHGEAAAIAHVNARTACEDARGTAGARSPQQQTQRQSRYCSERRTRASTLQRGRGTRADATVPLASERTSAGEGEP